jgi:uncharacterized protein involved in type VI secretion and phage assembly
VSDRYLGKFAGVVVNNKDPDGLCRVDVSVPAVLTGSTGWCLPALGYAGSGAGLAVVPPVGASVWVEWPNGDLAKPPIWSGAYFTSQNGGVPGAGPNTILLVTPGGHKIEVSDDSHAITLTASSGASITIDDNGITLDNGQGATIELSKGMVKINDDSLQVS